MTGRWERRVSEAARFRGEKDIIPPSEGGVLGSNPDGTAIKIKNQMKKARPGYRSGFLFDVYSTI